MEMLIDKDNPKSLNLLEACVTAIVIFLKGPESKKLKYWNEDIEVFMEN
eukprot:CAMPEP_0116902602 /NCGR_PEP_ID=MMETSP0467-20121206/10142_1 /TAXON_ID=283647 /ORGANISM="Mesodinium pulex, Strain SPMC105" /LENGTH=48 /DNA_ID= /DNA_START= /DNA_END= /DNA_ORIENTATION=